MHCFAYGFDCHMHNSLNCWIIVLIWKTKLPFLVGMIDKSIHGRGFYWLQFLSCFWPHFTTTWGEGDGAFGFSFVSSSILEVLSCNPTICANTYKFLPRDKPAYSRIQNGRLPRSCWEHWCNSRHAETCVVLSATNTLLVLRCHTACTLQYYTCLTIAGRFLSQHLDIRHVKTKNLGFGW